MKQTRYSLAMEKALKGDKFIAALDGYIWFGDMGTTEVTGDQGFRAKLRKAGIPHSRVAKEIAKPTFKKGPFMGTSNTVTHAIKVYVNCKPTDKLINALKIISV